MSHEKEFSKEVTRLLLLRIYLSISSEKKSKETVHFFDLNLKNGISVNIDVSKMVFV